MTQALTAQSVAPVVDKSRIEAEFSKNAGNYDAVAEVQRRIADRLIESIVKDQLSQLQEHELKSLTILDAGCGTGYLGRALYNQYRKYHKWHQLQTEQCTDLQHSDLQKEMPMTLTAFDLSSEMLNVAKEQGSYQHFIAGDIEALREGDRQSGEQNARQKEELSHEDLYPKYDLIMSSLAIQWCHDFKGALLSLQSVAKFDNGVNAFVDILKNPNRIYVTTLVEGTLYELASAFKFIDDEEHILTFETPHHIQESVTNLGGRVEFYQEVITFPDLKSLFKSLKGIGATNLPNRRKGLLGKAGYRKLEAYFKTLGQYQLTYVVAEIHLPALSRSK